MRHSLFLKIKDHVHFKKTQKDKLEINNKLKTIFCDSNDSIAVRRGPFQGMKYPAFVSAGSSLWPKLAGVYEMELQPVIYETLRNKYAVIMDIGCAEGYYAIGYALKNIADKVIAYDIDENAREMCENMAQTNGVKLETNSWCTEKTLCEFDFSVGDGQKSLIISDCEGYERELFTKASVSNLRGVDLIIEVHDWCQHETPTLDYLVDLFNESHDLEIIKGIDDYEKAYRYDVIELAGFNIQERFDILKENRRRLGVWIYLKAKSYQKESDGI